MNVKRILMALIFALTISMTAVIAQPGGGMGGHGGGMGPGGPMSSGVVDPVAMTGYFEMDAEKTIKKIKVKDEVEKSEIRKIFADFAVGSANVFADHPEEFQNLEAIKETMESAQLDGGSRTNMRELMMGTMVVKREMLVLHKALKSAMQKALASNEKSLKRWDLYYADICDTHNFSERQRQRGQGDQGGGQRGFGGGHPGGGMRGPGGF